MTSNYLNDDHFQNIHRYIDNGSEIHKCAYEILLAESERLLDQDVLSIRQVSGSPYLRKDAVYVPGQDGVFNAESNQEGLHLITRLSYCSLSLAYAYRMSGDTRFAEKAIDLIHGWCINENSRMYPTGRVEDPVTPGLPHGGNVGMMMRMPPLFLACYILESYPAWRLSAHAAVRRWIRAMLDEQRHTMHYADHEMYNNWEDARLRYLAYGALALDDLELLISVFDRWKQIIPIKMTDEGALPRECERTRSMSYTVTALGMAIDVAEIAESFQVDLYNYSHNGKSLKLAVDYANHHLLHIDEWPYQLLHPLTEELQKNQHFGSWEKAHHHWKDPRYLEAINAYSKRPHLLSHDTLIFGTS